MWCFDGKSYLNIVVFRPDTILNKNLTNLEKHKSKDESKPLGLYNQNDMNLFGEVDIYELKPHLQELHDFVLIPKESWDLFAAWYGFDFEIIHDPDNLFMMTNSYSNY